VETPDRSMPRSAPDGFDFTGDVSQVHGERLDFSFCFRLLRFLQNGRIQPTKFSFEVQIIGVKTPEEYDWNRCR
jgi:hypothetical protein